MFSCSNGYQMPSTESAWMKRALKKYISKFTPATYSLQACNFLVVSVLGGIVSNELDTRGVSAKRNQCVTHT